MLVLVGGGWFTLRWWSHRSAVAALTVKEPTPEQIHMIVGLFEDSDGRYLARARVRLIQLGKKSIPALLEACKEGKSQTQILAANCAMDIDEEEGLNAMESLISAPDKAVRKSVLLKLSQSGSKNPRIPGLLMKFADDSDPELRAAAAESLRMFPSKESEQVLKKLASDTDPVTARHAARNLRMLDQNKRRRRRR